MLIENIKRFMFNLGVESNVPLVIIVIGKKELQKLIKY